MFQWLQAAMSTLETPSSTISVGGEGDVEEQTSQASSEELRQKLLQEEAESHNESSSKNDQQQPQDPSEPDGLVVCGGSISIEGSNEDGLTTEHHRPPIYLPCAAYFFFEASISCIMPYLGVYYKDLGFSNQTSGMLQSLATFMLIVAAPLWGAVADMTRKLSETMLLTFTFGVLFRFSVFWAQDNLIYIVAATILWSSCHAPVDSLLDSSVIGMLNAHDKAHFGRFRSWSKLGNFVTSAIIGKIVSRPGGFMWAFYVHTALAVPAIICMYMFRFQQTSEDRRRIRREDVRLWDGLKLLCTSRRLVFAVIQILTAGISFGVITAFAYVLVKDRATRDDRSNGWDLVMGRTSMAVGAVGMYYVSGRIIDRFGAYPIMVCSLFSLSLSFFTYSVVDYGTTPFLWSGLLVAEFLRGGTFAILWATVMVYIDSISPSGSNSTMMTIMESIFKGLGHTLGALVGGFTAAQVGGLGELFLYMGCLQFVVALLSAVVAKLL